jgi:hypothetical protein
LAKHDARHAELARAHPPAQMRKVKKRGANGCRVRGSTFTASNVTTSATSAAVVSSAAAVVSSAAATAAPSAGAGQNWAAPSVSGRRGMGHVAG